MNNITKPLQKSSNFIENPYNATGLSVSIITNPIESSISRITEYFAEISQNLLNFAALVSLGAAQNTVMGGAL